MSKIPDKFKFYLFPKKGEIGGQKEKKIKAM